MNYLKIKSVGLLDVNALYLMGASTKKEDSSKIGQFGTGLKYAIAYMMRNEVGFKMFIGEKELSFEVRTEKIRDQEFKAIYCEGRSMNITTEYGYQWQAWEAIREIWCNAKDENTFSKSVKKDSAVISGVRGWTTFYIEMNEKVSYVVDNWSDYFISEKPIFENNMYAIYKNSGAAKFYKNGILVKSLEIPSALKFDLKNCELNELRQYLGSVEGAAATAILNSSKEVVDIYFKSCASKEDNFEKRIKFDYIWDWDYQKDHVKEIFQGRMYLHRDSNITTTDYALKPTEKLFDILKDCGLRCENIHKASGRSYGGGYSEKSDNIEYKPFNNEPLKKEIQSILDSYSMHLPFEIVVPFKAEFEFMINQSVCYFSVELERQSRSDLESIVLCAVVSRQNREYSSLKRLIKSQLENKNLKQILFNK